MTFLKNITHSRYFKASVVVIFFLSSFLAWIGVHIYGNYYLSTNNAYVNANVVQIAPRVTGAVARLMIANNQFVKKDDLLFAIDSLPFQLSINSAQAELDVAEAELENATITDQRIINLVKRKYLSPQDKDNSIAHFKIAQSKVEYAKAKLAQAILSLDYTKILAPASGWIANLTLRTGDIVLANQPLFALISDSEFWVDANFKETELADIKPGQAATITIDMYPDHPFDGVVESISGGAGTAFSLLPPQNATGNWVKVTQRVPVRIHVLNPNPHFPLRIGTTASVTIKLHEQRNL